MAERIVHPNYKIGGIECEIVTETELRENNFRIICGGVEQELDQFTEKELRDISRYVDEWRATRGRNG